MHMIKIMVSLGFFSFAASKIPTRPWQFSSQVTTQAQQSQAQTSSIDQLHSQFPELFQVMQLSAQEKPSAIDTEDINSLINIASLGYILFKICNNYQEMYIDQAPNTAHDSYLLQTLKNIIFSISPTFLINFGKHSQFFINSVAIMLTALIYKTIAKLIIWSANSDLADFSVAIVARLLKMMKTIVMC